MDSNETNIAEALCKVMAGDWGRQEGWFRALARTALSALPPPENDDAEALRGALRPFAEKATAWERRQDYEARDSKQIQHRLGDFRAARSALAFTRAGVQPQVPPIL